MTTQEKKTWLSQYRGLHRRIQFRLEELERLHSLVEGGTTALSGPGSRVEEGVEKIRLLQEKVNVEIDTLIEMRREVVDAINTVDDDPLRLLLEYRYLYGCTWEQIAEKLHGSRRRLVRRHTEALDRMEGPMRPVISLRGGK